MRSASRGWSKRLGPRGGPAPRYARFSNRPALQRTQSSCLFTGVDQGVAGGELQCYQRSLAIEEAMRDEVMLAYAMNGAPLQPQHGYPLRLIVPGWYGMASVKWLAGIEAIAQPFDGPQQQAYRYRQSEDDAGHPVDLIRVRSLISPPGVPDFLTRTRLVVAGVHRIAGRAWAGRLQVCRVEFSSDGGASWTDADLEQPVGEFAWRSWVGPVARDAGRARTVRSCHRRGRERTARCAAVELPRHGQQHAASG